MVVVAVLACLVFALVIIKFTKNDAGPGVSSVPITGPQAKRPATGPSASAVNKLGGASPKTNLPVPLPGQDRDLEIRVVDSSSKQPIPGAAVTISMDRAQQRQDRTENQGRAWVMLPPEDPKYVGIAIKADGYVQKRVDWRNQPIPMTHTFEMEKGTSIGGILKDEAGNPIAGASVNLLFPGDSTQGQRGVYVQESAKSDAEGKWRADSVPSELTNLSMRLSHPDFISDESYGSSPRPSDKDLREFSAVMVMKRGLVLTGVVTDQQGKPIANASILQGADRFGSNQPKTRSDPDGKFVFTNAKAGPTVLTVTAKTYAPELRSITAVKDMPPIEFKLAKGNVIRGKVVDINGKPISGAFVAADSWRGNRSLEWRVSTKADGSFVWNEGPSDQVLIHLGKQGFQSERNFFISPSDKEYVITLRPPQKIRGTVVDAESGNTISSFLIIPGIQWENSRGQVHWERDYNTKTGKDGKYDIQFDEPVRGGRLLRIEAPGYLPLVSSAYKPDDTDVVFDAKLTKGTGPAGIVKLADGTPAAGVDVALTTPSSGAAVRNGAIDIRSYGNGIAVKTDAQGKFEFVPQVEPFMLIAAGPAGYAEVMEEQFKKAKEIKLQPWGKVTGKFMMGSKPGANAQLSLYYNRTYEERAPRFYIQYETVTDKDGNFSIERVPAGDANVSRMVAQNMGRYSTSTATHTAALTIKPGETTTVQLGGVGRPVIGKVKIPPDAAGKGWTFHGGMNTKHVEKARPTEFASWTPEKQQEWLNAYYKSDEYKAEMKKMRHHNFQVAPDGSFRMEDVLPGAYNVHISVMEQRENFNGEQVAMAQTEAKIAEIPGGYTDEPLDLGTLELKELKRLKVGDDMSGFTAATADANKPFKFDDYKGKVVLIHFWAANHPESTTAMPKLKEIYQAHGENPKFAMIGFSFEQGGGSKAYVEKEQIKWTQVPLGQNSTIYQELGLRQFPAYILIGTDGKVIAKDMPVDQLKVLVNNALPK
jgi:uncharacterized GH25 family protein